MRILGIDPGSQVTGYGVIESREIPVAWGVIRLKEKTLAERLLRIHREILTLIEKFDPAAVAFEEVIPETFPRAALKLGQAQGAAIIAAASTGKSIFFYHPLEVKKALTGYGNASKEQLRYMVKTLLGLKEDLPTDASDALAVAIFHAQKMRFTHACPG
ncbi:crossover junction endodeoxyribonuclease RuvC [Thermodesulfatator atlanticus]|uniref:crossover junction endodeoxyribonuclease RuvC n=1 Tax=Thermodesulfatator atlanticus TaxID=501497 RepID=UPI0003B48DCB|nr:crossover junction endodeoxyribonuclease RuvC [Thermodesulfatator atlanticus]